MMKQLLLSTLLVFGMSNSVQAQEVIPININKVCSAIVNIPYASDNFTDKEWEQFKECLAFMKHFSE